MTRPVLLRRTPTASTAVRRAFTLLEIMVVILIIGAIVGIAIPRFGDVFQTNVKGALRRLGGTIKFCFHESVIKQSVIRLNIDPVTGEYWPSILVTQGAYGQFVDHTNEIFQERARLPEGIRFADIVTPHDVLKKDQVEAFISFYPTGYAEAAVIHLVDAAGRFTTMVVQPLTGEVELQDGYIDYVQLGNQGPFSQGSSRF